MFLLLLLLFRSPLATWHFEEEDEEEVPVPPPTLANPGFEI